MTREEILVLAKAGFTAAQIAALSSVQQQVQQPSPQPVQQPAPQPVQQPAPQPVQQPAPQPNFDDYMDKMDELIRTVQASNVVASRNDVRVDNTDDILAAIINPPTMDRGGAK